MADAMTAADRDFLAAVLADLPSEVPKLVYADWLEEQGDARGPFLRAFVEASRSMDPAAFPDPAGLPEEWLELVGFRLLERAATAGVADLRDALLRLARPALSISQESAGGDGGALGASKVGGRPDLPPGAAWPMARECRATFDWCADEIDGLDGPAEFFGQLNFAEVAGTQAAREAGLPEAGLLSVFYTKWCVGIDDRVAVGVMFFPEADGLVRAEPPPECDEYYPQLIRFAEVLDLPQDSGDQHSAERGVRVPYPVAENGAYYRMLGHLGDLANHDGPSFGQEAWRPTRRHRHLVTWELDCDDVVLVIDADDLAARRFDRVVLYLAGT